MIHALILSNTLSELEQISKNLLRSTEDSLCLITTTDSHEALSTIHQGRILFDIFIIAVRLEKQSGFMIEKQIRKIRFYQQVPILFLTPDSRLFGFDPLSTFPTYRLRNYLTLPLDDLDIQGKFCLYLDSIYAKQMQVDRQKKKIRLKSAAGSRDIPIQNILYIEVQNKLCTIYSLNGKFLLRRTSLSSAIAQIHAPSIVRCHRFFAANLENVDYIERNHARLSTLHFKSSSLTCPASKVYLADVQTIFAALPSAKKAAE